MRCLIVGVYFVAAIAMAAPTCLGDDDAAIARRVAEKLRFQQERDALQGFHITVKVEDGTVWMMGDVADTDQRSLALDVARRVPGVRLVVNDLDVASKAAEPPATATLADRQPLPKPRPDARSSVQRTAGLTQVNSPPHPIASPAVSGPVGSGIGQFVNVPASAQQLRVAQLQGAACYDGSCNPGTANGYSGGGGYVDGGVIYEGGYGGGYGGVSSGQPQLPNYAWPAYASYPNYGAVTYPRQYSPQAWPYIGPFYPYPQVPLGWRKVALEWDDGWWMLDFSSK